MYDEKEEIPCKISVFKKNKLSLHIKKTTFKMKDRIKGVVKTSKHYFKHVCYILFDVVLIFAFSTLFSFFFDFSWADPSNLFRESNEDLFSTKTFYQIKNYEECGDSVECFVLADFDDLTSREKIAAFIDSIYGVHSL